MKEELTEYVATDAIKRHFSTVLKAIASAPREPREGVGIWISGFFGSGKSLFAKILGYTLSSRQVLGRTATDLFLENVSDEKLSELLQYINTSIPTEAVIFDISKDRNIRHGSESIISVMYRTLLRELGYSQEFDMAELEIWLEKNGHLEDFIRTFNEELGRTWDEERDFAMGILEASTVLNTMFPKIFPDKESWARALGSATASGDFPGRARVSAKVLVERSFELMERRRPGKALIFIIDEVGQFISRSVDRMLDLSGVVEEFGTRGKNLVKAGKATAPCWVIVTSQEKLDEVVSALGDRKVELARLQDRFPIAIDLKQSDISEITAKRVLSKNETGASSLSSLYRANEGRLAGMSALERTSRETALTEGRFIQLYPYLPYQIDLCIDIVSGLRLRRGGQRHIGGSNRTIIKQAQQMLVHPRTNLADRPVGTLVTLDAVYELLYEGNLLPSEITREVDSVPKHIPGDPVAHRVAKAIALLEVVKNLPLTPQNIAVALHPHVEADSLIEEVSSALKALESAQFVRESGEGYKLLTTQEKQWEKERGDLVPKRGDRKAMLRDLIVDVFSDPNVRTYRYKTVKSFKLGLRIEGEASGEDGQIPFNILISEDVADMEARADESRTYTRDNVNEVVWLAALNNEIHNGLVELFRSNKMINTGERYVSKGEITPEESACLADEKVRKDMLARDLRARIIDALQSGSAFFRGQRWDGSELGTRLPEMVKALIDSVILGLYPKLEVGTKPVTGKEPENVLEAANLKGLPAVLYEGADGFGLIVKEGAQYVPNPEAEVAKEILDHVKNEHSFGNKVTGKSLEAKFRGIGYGWERDVLRLVLAVLFRADAIEVTHQGRRYRDHSESVAHVPFTKNAAFKAATFAPREAMNIKMKMDAAKRYEDITGREIDYDSESAIASAFREVASEDRDAILHLKALMDAHELPGRQFVADHLAAVDEVLQSPTEDCVGILAGQGSSYRDARVRVGRMEKALTEANVELIRRARCVLGGQWPELCSRQPEEGLAERASELESALSSEDLHERFDSARSCVQAIDGDYRSLYTRLHEERNERISGAIEEVRGTPEWATLTRDETVSEKERDAILRPLTSRTCGTMNLDEGAAACSACRGTIGELEADIAAAGSFCAQVLDRLRGAVAPEESVERVRLASVIHGVIDSEEDARKVVERLREHLFKLLAQGKKIVLE